MVSLSHEARQQVADLVWHFEHRDRPEAVRNLRAAIAEAVRRIESQRGPFFPAPRPYPRLQMPQWRWLKERRYWIAFTHHDDQWVVVAVFYEAADIPTRMG